MPTGPDAQIDLAAFAARLSQADGDGHRWDEEDARQWLIRAGLLSHGDRDGTQPPVMMSECAGRVWRGPVSQSPSGRRTA